MANQIKYQVGFDVQKQGLEQVKKSLRQIQQMTAKDFMKINGGNITQATIQLGRVKEQAQKVEQALRSSFNTKLNTVNIQRFHAKLKQLNGSGIQKTYQEFAKLGAAGENAFRKLTSSSLTATKQLRQSHNILDKMATTLANTVKWQIASSAVNGVTRSIEQAWGYSKALDTSLNNIQIVTGKSADEMSRFAEQANSAAKQLGKTTTDYTDAALIFAQQGLNDEQIAQRADLTLKTANVTGQSAEAVSEELTAVWNGYKVSAEQAELYIDRLAAIAATTASDLGELSTGMSKVAAAAAEMGVGEDQLAAQLSTIISVTKQAPESVGTALRTVYARISDIQAGIEQDGTTLGNYSGKMAELGINVLDTNGKLRDMGAVIEQIGAKWGDMTREQQINLAQTMAGQRQYSNLMALFQNFDKYNEAMQTAAGAAGTLQEQQDIYMESTAAHLNQLKASVEDIYDSIFNMDSMDEIIDVLSGAADLFANFIDSIGGGGKLLQSFGAIAVSVFSNQIARGIATTINNFEQAQLSAQSFKDALANNMQMQNLDGISEFVRQLYESEQIVLRLQRGLSPEEFTGLMGLIDKMGQANAQVQKQQEEFQKLADIVNKLYSNEGQNLGDKIFKNRGTEQAQIASEKLRSIIEEQQNKFDGLEAAGEKALGAIAEKTDDAVAKTQKYIQILNDLKGQGFFEKEAQEIDKLSREFQEANGDLEKISATMQKFDVLMNNYYKKTSGSRAQLGSRVLQQLDKGVIKDRQKEASDNGEKYGREFINGVNRGLRTQKIEDIAKIISGLGQLSMGIQQIQNLGSIWKNADLSTGEKLLQTITNLSFSLPMLAKGFTDVGTRLGFFTVTSQNAISNSTKEIETLVKKQNAQASIESATAAEAEAVAKQKNTQASIKQTAAEKASAEAKKENATASTANATAQQAENISDEKGVATKTAEAAAEKTSEAAKKTSTVATGELAAAKTAQNTVTQAGVPIQAADTVGKTAGAAATSAFGFAVEDATIKLTLFNTTMSISPLGAFIMLTAAAIAAIGAYANSVDKARAAEAQHQKELIDEENKIQQQIKSHENLYQSLEDLEDRYKSGDITREELVSSVDNLIDQYDKEDAAVQLLTGHYQNLSEAIKEAKSKDIEQQFESSRRQQDAADKAYKEKSEEKFGADQTATIYAQGLDEQQKQLFKDFADIQSDYINGTPILKFDLSNPEQVSTLLQDIREKAQELGIEEQDLEKMEPFSALKKKISQVSDQLKQCKQAADNLADSRVLRIGDLAEQNGQFDLQKSSQNLFNYMQQRQSLAKQFVADDYEDKFKNADAYLKSENNAAFSQYNQLAEFIDKINPNIEITQEFLDRLEKFDGTQIERLNDINPNTMGLEQLANLLDRIQNHDYDKILSLEEADSLISGAQANYVQMQDIQDKVNNNKDLSSTQGKNLAELHPQIIKEFFDVALDGSYKMTGSIAKFNEAMQQIKTQPFQEAMNAIQNALDKIHVPQNFEVADERLTTDASTLADQKGVPSNIIEDQQATLGADQLDYITKFGDMNQQLHMKIMGWTQALKDGGDAAKAIYPEMAQEVKKISDNTGQAAKKQEELEEKSKALKEAMYEASHPLDEDVDVQQRQKLIDLLDEQVEKNDELDDSIKGNREVLGDLAEQMLRYKDSLKDVEKGYDKWKKALDPDKSGMADAVEYMDQLSDAYGDMLDIDGSQLSEDFLADANNLQLMKAAAEGSQQAYEKLADAANDDIALQVDLDRDQFDSDLNGLLDEYYDVKDLDDIQAGAQLNDAGFLAALSNLVTAAGMTAAQAEAYLGNMGIDAKVVQHKTEGTETKQDSGFETVLRPHTAQGTYPVISGQGKNTSVQQKPTLYRTYSSQTIPRKSTSTDKKQNTAFTLEVTSAHKKSGGGFKQGQARHNGGSGGKSGGGCFAAQTLITIPNGKYKFIEDIQIGDVVLSYNVEKRVNEYSKVVETMIHDLEESIYTIYIEDDILISTGIHPFYIVREQSYEWVEASDLNVGDLVLFADGTIHQISNIQIKYQSIRVYNFEVSGNHNYYVGINQILVHNKGSGGGKSEKKDTSKATAIKKETKEVDPYFRVNRQLSNQEHILKNLEKSTERAFGKNKLDLLKQQEEALKRQNELLKEKQELNKKEIESLNKRYKASNKLSKKNKDDDVAAAIGLTKKEKKKTKNKSEKKQGSKLKKEKFKNEEGYGFEYDSDGEITNYTQLQNSYYKQMEKRRKQYNKAKKKYDAMTKKEQKDKYKQNVLEVLKYNYQLWKDRLDKMKDAAEKYVDELELNKEITEKLQENFAAEIQLRIQKFAVAVEVDLDLRDATRKWNDFVRNVINKQDLLKQNPFKDISLDMQRALKDYTTYLDKNGTKGTGDLKSLIDQVNKSNAELKRTLSGDTTGTYGNDITKGTQDLKKWYDQLLDAMQQTVDLQEEIQQGYLDIHENAIEMLDEAIEKREYINELLEHEIDLYQLTYGINPDIDYYNTMNGYYEALYSNQLQQIDRLRANTVLLEEQWKKQLTAGNTELAKQYEQAYKSSLSSLNSLLIESIETLKEKYSNAIDGIFNELDRHLSGGSSLGYMNMEWQLMNQNAELYLDNVNTIYSMESLQNKFQKAIDDNKNVKSQQALKKVMDEQLDILKQKGKITKYDVERAEKLLQIEKARIALEQSQSNKTSMRLKRDAQGNYSYQFVADTSQVEDAQQALLDLQNQLYNFDKQAYQDNLNAALSAYQDYQSRVKEILLDTALTQQEKDKQIALLNEQLGEYINNLAIENSHIRINLVQSTVDSLTSAYNRDYDAFKGMTDDQIELIWKLQQEGRDAYKQLSEDEKQILKGIMIPQWDSGIQTMMDKISGEGGFEQICLDAWDKITTATTDYQTQVKKVAEAAGQDLGSITSSTWALNSSILDTLDSQKNLTQAFSDQIGTANSLLGKLEELRKAYEQLATAAKNAAQAAGQTITTASNEIKNGNTTTGGSTSGNSGGSTIKKQTVTNKQAEAALSYILNHLKWSDKQGASWGKLNKSLWTKNRKVYLPEAAEKQAYKKLGSPSGSYSNEKLLDVLKKTGIWKVLTSMSTTKDGVSAALWSSGDVHGYVQGTKKIPKDMIAWTQEQGQEAIYDKSRQAMLTPLGKGDKVFTAEMTDALWNVAEAIVNSKQTTQPNNPSWDMLKDQSKRRSINQAQVDTAKGMAAAVELLRDISQELPTSLFDKAFNLNNGYLKDLIANISKDVFNNVNDTQQTQQTVTITASFPAVNSKKEIEEAFENLINMAAQRTMRNNNDNRRRRGL